MRAGVLAAAEPGGTAPAGATVVGSRPAPWAAGLVLLAAWMPFNNGLRPGGQIATGALITYVLIERAIMSGRLTPFAFAIIAAFTLGIQPTGLIAVAALIAGGRPILRIPGCAAARRRHLAAGRTAAGPQAPVILTVVFADQHLAAVLRRPGFADIGPSQAYSTPRTCGTTT